MFNSFLKRSFYFIAVFIAINALLDFSYKKIVMKNSKLNARERGYQQKKGNIKTLILGDSHSAAGVNTEILGKTSLNFSASGENYLLNYSKLKLVLDEDIHNKIETILVPFDLHSVSSFRNNRITDNSYWISYINFWEELWEQRNWTFFAKWVKSKFFSYAGESENIAHYFRAKGVYKIKEGINYRTRDFSKNKKAKELAKYRAEVHFKDAELLDKLAKRHLEKIYKLSKDNNKRLVLIALPIPTIYLEETEKIIDITKVKNEMTTYRKTMFPDIPFYDFQDIFLDKTELFDDQDHLNFKGAEIFSRQLLDSLKSNDLI